MLFVLRKIVFGGCSSVVEPRIVTPVVVGSSPIIHPITPAYIVSAIFNFLLVDPFF